MNGTSPSEEHGTKGTNTGKCILFFLPRCIPSPNKKLHGLSQVLSQRFPSRKSGASRRLWQTSAPCFPRLPRAGRSSSRAPRALPQLAHVTLIDSPARRSPSHRPSAAACQSQRLTAPHWLACAPRSSLGSAALRAHRTRWRRWGAGWWAEKRALRGRGRWAGRSPALAVAGPRQRPTLVRRTRLAERPRLRPRPRRPRRSQPPPLDSGGALVC